MDSYYTEYLIFLHPCDEKKLFVLIIVFKCLQLTIDHIWSLILVKSNNYSIERFDLTEINDMISFLTTNWDIWLKWR